MAAANSGAKQSYVLDKLHSLSGIVPIGAFLVEHFWSNSYALVSVQKYDDVSRELQTIPWRIIVEALGIWLPLLFHSFYGFYIWWKGKSNSFAHPWMANWMYTLQRWSGIAAFFFIAWHLYVERFLTQGKSTYAGTAHAMQDPMYVAFYIVGVVATSFHFGNGLWNFSCKWGLTVSKRSQRLAAYGGALVALLFMVIGIAIVIGFRFDWRPFEFYTQ
jgi:succinate dehydrogenase / fumarate reductase, cytochrome b subunit